MIDLYSAKEVKNIEKTLIDGGVEEIALVFKAARGILKLLDLKKSYTIVCGKGNNGADGFCLASLLMDEGVKVNVVYLSERFTDAEGYFYQKCLYRSINVQKYDGNIPYADVIFDCVFGIGFHGELSGDYLSAVNKINEMKERGALIYSADIPSGLSAENGLAGVCVKADKTFIIGKNKVGEFLGSANDFVGETTFVDIGLKGGSPCAKLVEISDFSSILKDRKRNSNKYDYGFVGILGGSESYSGAVKLSNLAAIAASSGAGVVRLIVSKDIAPYVAPYLLESTLYTVNGENGHAVFDERSLVEATNKLNSLAVGMGMTDCEDTRKIVTHLLKTFTGTLIIDADGLNSIKSDVSVLKDAAAKKVILTPHTGEFSRLLNKTRAEIEEDPIAIAKTFAKEYGVILLLKGPSTIVTDGESVFVINKGTAGMATAGSGDVLSGVISAIHGYNEPTALSVACAAYICGLSAELAEKDISVISHTASDTVAYIKRAIKIIADKEQNS